jgi:hypothetical protein
MHNMNIFRIIIYGFICRSPRFMQEGLKFHHYCPRC